MTLTPRQNAVVLELARDGADNETIARRLGIAVDTVKTHLKAALAATGLMSRTELAVAVLRGHLEFTVENRRYRPNTSARISRGEWS